MLTRIDTIYAFVRVSHTMVIVGDTLQTCCQGRTMPKGTLANHLVRILLDLVPSLVTPHPCQEANALWTLPPRQIWDYGEFPAIENILRLTHFPYTTQNVAD